MKIANRHRRCLLATLTLVVPLNTGVSGKYPFLFPIQWPPVLFLSLPFAAAAAKKANNTRTHIHTHTHTHTQFLNSLIPTTKSSLEHEQHDKNPQKPQAAQNSQNLKALITQKEKEKKHLQGRRNSHHAKNKLFFLPSSSSIIMTFTAILEKSSRSLQSLKNHEFYCNP
jgi:hypothetical protein